MNVILEFDTISATDVATAGGKGANLGETATAGLPVPPGFVIATEGYDRFISETGISEGIQRVAGAVDPDDHTSAEQASREIAQLFATANIPDDLAGAIDVAYRTLTGEDDLAVAVRSSATAEDLEDASFAGQQDTYLNIRGRDALLSAVRDCWGSLWTPRAIAYRLRQGIDPATVSLAVVVQELVDADSAGVMFTANPSNGRRDETVIAAAWGLGESVVGGSVTTDNLILRQRGDEWTIMESTVADKEVLTVRTATGTEEVAVPAERRRAAVLTVADARRLAELGAQITDHYGAPMDIEWVRAGDTFFIVQARRITALPEPVGDPPEDWRVEDRTAFYMRASIVEMMPEPLTPLFGDMVAVAVPTSLRRLFNTFMQVLGEKDLTFPTINGYAYYAYSRAGLLRVGALTPLFLLQTYRRSGNAEEQWRDRALPLYRGIVDQWKSRRPEDLSAVELLDGAEALLTAGCTYYTSVQMIIPVAATTELSFASLYDKAMRRADDPPATTFLLGLDSQPMRAEQALYDLAQWARAQAELTKVLEELEPAVAIDPTHRPSGVSDQLWSDWSERIADYLERYGHTVYNLDFASAVAADDPSPVLQALLYYASGQAEDPRLRRGRQVGDRESATEALLGRLDPVRRWMADRLLAATRRYGPIREDALADVGLAWPVIRRMLRELGRRLVDAGVISDRDDVFWLRVVEARVSADALDQRDPIAEMAVTVEERKMQSRGEATVTPPQILPDNRIGRLFERWMPSPAGSGSTGPVLEGLGASGGRVTGEACLITDPSLFEAMRPGRIIVAKITTPAYTPLFAMASAVVTDVGGPLSHSSIVAREYGIPAVLGTGVATQRIKDGQQITVDGTTGQVLLDPSIG